MRNKFLVLAICLLALLIAPASSFASSASVGKPDKNPNESPMFDFPRPGQTTLSDWAAASAIVQSIQLPNIPAKEFKVENTGDNA